MTTIHILLGIKNVKASADETIATLLDERKDAIKKLKFIIIDDGMLYSQDSRIRLIVLAHYVDEALWKMMDEILRRVRGKPQQFGGVAILEAVDSFLVKQGNHYHSMYQTSNSTRRKSIYFLQSSHSNQAPRKVRHL